MGSWNESSMDVMEFEIPRPTEDIVQGYSSTWDQHVMDIDYDVRLPSYRYLIVCLTHALKQVSQGLFLILDTNFLIKHLSLLDTVAKKVLENESRIPPLFFVLPGVVVDELDYQSKYGVRERAVAATNWLQDQIQIRLRTGQGVLRAQKEDETLRGGKSWRNLRGRGVSDRNLSLKATISEIPTMSISKNMSTIDFLKEVLPGLRWDPPSAPTAIDRSSSASRWAGPPSRSRSTPRVVVPEPSLNLSTHDVIHDNDIDMDDISRSPMAYSPYPPSKHEPVYAQIYEDPLENLVGNLRRNGVLSRLRSRPTSCPYPESPRQALSRISESIPASVLYFISERNEAGYRAGGIRMWSIGDIEEATSTLERLFHEMKKQDSDQDQDQVSARKALVSIVDGFKEDAIRWLIRVTEQLTLYSGRVATERLLISTISAGRLSTSITPLTMHRRQSIAVPSGTNKENGSRVAKMKRTHSIGGPMDAYKGANIGADGLSPRRRKSANSMLQVPRKSILKMHNDEEETMDMTTVVGGINSDMTMGRKSLARRVSFAAMCRMFEPTVNSNATASSPSHSSSPAAPHTSNDAPTPQKSPVSTRRANSVEAGEASMELDDESMEGGDSFGAGDDEPQEFDGGEGAGEDSMDLTDTYQIGTPSRRRSSAPLGPLPPLDRSIERHNHRAKEDSRTQESTSDKDNGEYLVKTGKSIVPRRKSEAWAELQSLTNAGGSDMDEDSTGSTMNSDTGGGFIPASQESSGNAGFSSQGTGFSSQGTYSVVSSQEGDIGLEDAISRLRAARQSMGAGAADMSIDDEDGQSSSSGDFEGGYDDDDRTMDVTAVTGGLRFTEDDDEDEEAEPESEKIPSEPSQPADKPPEPAPAFKFFSQPEAASRVEITTQALATNLPTFAIDPPPPPVPQTGAAPSAPFTFTFPSPSKPTEKPAAAPKPTATIPAFSFDITPSEVAPSSAEPAESTPSIGSMRSAPPSAGPSKLTPPADPQPVARSPITFEVSQSPIRAPPATWSPRNAPRPFEFKLGTPRRTSVSAPGANPALDANSTPNRATTPIPAGTPKVVEAPARATSAPPTPKRSREEVEAEPSAKRVALEAGSKKATDGPAKPPRRRSFAPRMSIMGRPGARLSIIPAEPEPEVESEPIQLPTPESVQPPSPLLPQPSLPMREPSPAQPSRPRTPEPLPSPREASPRPAAAALEEIRISSPLRSRVSSVGINIPPKSPAQWRTGGGHSQRRSTIGLGILSRRKSGEKDPVAGVADYITAAKELKEYISNGKKAIRILEEDLDANNPYLFKEYLASGEEDRRALEETLGGHKEAMRMRSKMSWYKWRHNFVTEMQATADRETELLQQDLDSLRAVGTQLTEPIPSLREQHAKLKAQLAAERAAVEAAKDCDPEIMSELKVGIAEQSAQIESYKTDIQSSTVKLEKLKAKLGEAEGDKQALQDQIRVHQEKLDALHPTVEIVNLREEFEKLQRLHLWHAVKLEEKFIELRYDDHYRVQMDCVAFKPIPSGCRILVIPPKGKQTDEFPVLSELVLDLAQAMIRRIQNLNLKKVVRMLGRLWTSVSHLRCNLRLLAMKYPVTITRADCGFGFKATTRVRFPSAKGLTKITFIFQEQHIRDWGKQLNTLDVDVEVVFGKLEYENSLNGWRNPLTYFPAATTSLLT
ncbi:Spc7 domain-containing protein [Rhizoctonia solani AG-1 IA]|uniref:Spc7 domain-containing protein n=1 Tax=Thanatephorus cucumeris (strain AG1-IA) TaxID=983506 RepID=L8X3M3_THACA|nr:Spc7 domain-containing protein [Rhizoctonia solani AG-1 IA]